MATFQEIMMLRNQPSPLAQLGEVVSDVYGTYKRKEKEQAALEKGEAAKLEAFKLLSQSEKAQDPAQREQLFMQAYAASPDLVSGIIKAQKTRREGMGGTAKPMTDYQKASIDMRKKEAELRALEQQQSKEQNDLKKQQLQLKIEAQKEKLNQDKLAVQQSAQQDLGTIENTLNTVNQLSDHEGLEAAVGTSSVFPTVAGSAASDFEAKLEQLKSQQFLAEVSKMKGMGALSENEGKKLGAAAASLDLSMSEDAFKKELKYIQDTMTKARNKIAGSLPKKEQAKEVPQDQGMEGRTATNPQTGQVLVYRGGQWQPQ